MITSNTKNIVKVIFLFIFLSANIFSMNLVQAQSVNANVPEQYSNINDKGFKLLICDGPENAGRIDDTGSVDLTKNKETGKFNTDVKDGYIPCNFRGLMMQIQHLINIMMILGVVVAIAGFCFIGFLYIKGGKGDIDRAKSIFPKIFFGFVIMLSAWFVVYQILEWLTDPSSGANTLLGNP